jgi:hypothetical protein
MTESGSERVLVGLIGFLRAENWPASRRILIECPELLGDAAEHAMSAMTADPAAALMLYPGLDPAKAARLLRMHEALLSRCRQIGVYDAFTEMTGTGEDLTETTGESEDPPRDPKGAVFNQGKLG